MVADNVTLFEAIADPEDSSSEQLVIIIDIRSIDISRLNSFFTALSFYRNVFLKAYYTLYAAKTTKHAEACFICFISIISLLFV